MSIPSVTRCFDGNIQFSLFHQSGTNFDEAKIMCEGEPGRQLGRIENDEQNQFVSQMITDLGIPDDEGVWIGLIHNESSTLPRSDPRRFQWIDGSTEDTEFYAERGPPWRIDDPNDDFGIENCVQ